jgi:hypothetical protein
VTLSIAYRGNFQPDLPDGIPAWSTETHVAGSLEALGHEVVRVQEDRDDWSATARMAKDCDLFLWTQTYDFAHRWPREDAEMALGWLGERMPTAGVHLDLWWGLQRERELYEEPFFNRLQYLFTADGDHDQQWVELGVEHHWMPPAVYRPDCVPGTPVDGWDFDVAFVGSWEGYGHAEWWPHRSAMLDFLTDRYGDRFHCWPEPGKAAVRGEALNNVMASVKVVVGDSCFADRSNRYFSDRAFETMGRGGCLVTPHVPGFVDIAGLPGVHYMTFPPDDMEALRTQIDYLLTHDEERRLIQASGQHHTRLYNTYENRLSDVLDVIFPDDTPETPER